MSFGTALTGLNAAKSDLEVISNNLANSQTVGFKSSRAEFADMFSISRNGLPRLAIGQGVRLAAVTRQFSQGQLDHTGNVLDLGIRGNGFFRLNDNGTMVYSRAGAFQLDQNGYIVDAHGRRLTGYAADKPNVLTDLQIAIGDVPAKQTNTMSMIANLQAGSEPPTGPAFPAGQQTNFDPDPESYNYSTSTTVYDSLGKAHLMTFYFIKEDPAADPAGSSLWTVRAQVGDTLLAESYTLDFSDTTGALQGGPANFDFDLTGVIARDTSDDNTPEITVDMSKLSQFGTPSGVTKLSPDGYPPGQYAGLGIETDGVIYAFYSNGQTLVLGQLALAEFPSPQNLQPIGDTAWMETYASGTPLVDVPHSSVMGEIQSGSLEMSNVDVSGQLVEMITAQRAYQANAKMISTQDQITQELLNIR